MRRKLFALAVTAMLAVGTAGVVAANVASTGPDEATDEHTNAPSTVQVDGYEIEIADRDDWFAGERADDRATVAELVLADADAGDRFRDLFDEQGRIEMDVYGDLQRADDRAHARIHPAERADHGDPRPVLEVTVDLGAETVEVVGVSTDPVQDDDRLTANESETYDVRTNATDPAGETLEVRLSDPAGNYTFVSAEDSVRIDVPAEAVGGDGGEFRIDLPANRTIPRTAEVGDDLELVDERGELTAAEFETVRDRVAADDAASEALRDRFGEGAEISLTVAGVGPSGEVQLDATAEGDGPETVAVASLHEAGVTVESAALLTASDAFQTDRDVEYEVVDESSD
ncbi:hypothetical protein [Halorientalis halophila]|uniref:hypothetical protein n=1 Tax=Halorientalis halophila TaxID=3108499 RepID=UPI00300BD354